MTEHEFRVQMLKLVLRRAHARGITLSLANAQALVDGFVEESKERGVTFE